MLPAVFEPRSEPLVTCRSLLHLPGWRRRTLERARGCRKPARVWALAAEKRLRQNRSLSCPMRAARHQAYAPPLNSARIAGPSGDQALQRLDHLPGKLLLQFVDLLRVGNEVLIRVPGEIALNLHGVAERARAF